MTNTLRPNFAERAKAQRFQTRAFIDGRFVDALDGKTFTTVNPANGEVPVSYTHLTLPTSDLV